MKNPCLNQFDLIVHNVQNKYFFPINLGEVTSKDKFLQMVIPGICNFSKNFPVT